MFIIPHEDGRVNFEVGRAAKTEVAAAAAHYFRKRATLRPFKQRPRISHFDQRAVLVFRRDVEDIKGCNLHSNGHFTPIIQHDERGNVRRGRGANERGD